MLIFTNVFKVINSPGYNFPPKDSVFFGKIDFRSFCCQWYFRVKIRNNVGPLKSASVCIHSFNYACVKGRKTLFKPINSSCLVPSSFKPVGKKIHRKVFEDILNWGNGEGNGTWTVHGIRWNLPLNQLQSFQSKRRKCYAFQDWFDIKAK